MKTAEQASATDLTKASSQILAASLAGTDAFNRGAGPAPCRDAAFFPVFSSMIQGRTFCETPDGEASTVDILDAWISAWHAANAVTLSCQ